MRNKRGGKLFPRCVIPSLVSFLITMGGCSTSELSADEMRTVVGTVHVIGNEPFTRLALEMENKRVFVLECSNTLRAMLLTKQGQVVRVHFRKIKAVPEGEAVEVSDVEEISH